MSRPIVVVSLAVLALLQATLAVDVSTTKNIEVDFTDKDVVPKTALKSLTPETYASGFIGDLEIGRRFSDETVFRRVVEVNNPTNVVQSSALSLTVQNGVIHYLSVRNANGNYAAVCDQSNSIGSSRSIINIRVSPNTRSSLVLVMAVHVAK